MRNRNADSLLNYQAFAGAVSAVLIPSALSPLVAPGNIFVPAVTELLMLRCPAGAGGMQATENFITTGCPAIAPQPINQVNKPVELPSQPQKLKIAALWECPAPDIIREMYSEIPKYQGHRAGPCVRLPALTSLRQPNARAATVWITSGRCRFPSRSAETTMRSLRPLLRSAAPTVFPFRLR